MSILFFKIISNNFNQVSILQQKILWNFKVFQNDVIDKFIDINIYVYVYCTWTYIFLHFTVF